MIALSPFHGPAVRLASATSIGLVGVGAAGAPGTDAPTFSDTQTFRMTASNPGPSQSAIPGPSQRTLAIPVANGTGVHDQ